MMMMTMMRIMMFTHKYTLFLSLLFLFSFHFISFFFCSTYHHHLSSYSHVYVVLFWCCLLEWLQSAHARFNFVFFCVLYFIFFIFLFFFRIRSECVIIYFVQNMSYVSFKNYDPVASWSNISCSAITFIKFHTRFVQWLISCATMHLIENFSTRFRCW